MNEALLYLVKVGSDYELLAHIVGGCVVAGGGFDEGDNAVLVSHDDVTDVVGERSSYGLDSFIKEVPGPILELRHPHY